MVYENLTMGLLLIEQARHHGLERFVAISSACAYSEEASTPTGEQELWRGYLEESNGPYGVAKRVLILLGQVYRQQYGLNAISLIPINLYGPGDNFDPFSAHVIPALIRKCIEARDAGSKRIEVWGTGNASRDFLYVEDAAEAIVLATERYNKPYPLNIASRREVAIRELVRTIGELTGFRGDVVWDPSKPDGQPMCCLDISREETEFGFKASTPLEVGLKKTIEWNRQQRACATTMPHAE
jgi:GDP-L-fucose synthase